MLLLWINTKEDIMAVKRISKKKRLTKKVARKASQTSSYKAKKTVAKKATPRTGVKKLHKQIYGTLTRDSDPQSLTLQEILLLKDFYDEANGEEKANKELLNIIRDKFNYKEEDLCYLPHILFSKSNNNYYFHIEYKLNTKYSNFQYLSTEKRISKRSHKYVYFKEDAIDSLKQTRFLISCGDAEIAEFQLSIRRVCQDLDEIKKITEHKKEVKSAQEEGYFFDKEDISKILEETQGLYLKEIEKKTVKDLLFKNIKRRNKTLEKEISIELEYSRDDGDRVISLYCEISRDLGIKGITLDPKEGIPITKAYNFILKIVKLSLLNKKYEENNSPKRIKIIKEKDKKNISDYIEEFSFEIKDIKSSYFVNKIFKEEF